MTLFGFLHPYHKNCASLSYREKFAWAGVNSHLLSLILPSSKVFQRQKDSKFCAQQMLIYVHSIIFQSWELGLVPPISQRPREVVLHSLLTICLHLLKMLEDDEEKESSPCLHGTWNQEVWGPLPTDPAISTYSKVMQVDHLQQVNEFSETVNASAVKW